MLQLLVSVRDMEEALGAAAEGADFIDCKEPAEGALGALAPPLVAQIVSVLRVRHPQLRISATVGDLPADRIDEILARVARTACCGVDYVKVGLWPGEAREAEALLRALATCGATVVPVLLADDGVDRTLLACALAQRAFPALMLDTAQKRRGSLLQRVAPAALAEFVAAVRAQGTLAGLAGSLRAEDVDALLELGPDFAGFRGALTRGGRSGALDLRLLRRLRRRLAAGAEAGDGLPAGA